MALPKLNGGSTQPRPSFWAPRRLTRLALLIALSGVGSLIKIPSPIGTVALDSAPGFFAAAAFGPWEGALVAGFGHIFSAATAGFPLGLLLHVIVGLQQAVWAVLFWLLATRVNLWAGIFGAVLCNGVIAPAMFIPILGTGVFAGMVIPLTVGSAVNVAIAGIACKFLKRNNLV